VAWIVRTSYKGTASSGFYAYIPNCNTFIIACIWLVRNTPKAVDTVLTNAIVLKHRACVCRVFLMLVTHFQNSLLLESRLNAKDVQKQEISQFAIIICLMAECHTGINYSFEKAKCD